ncbi:hypothetical protein CN085_31650 [Sinorhizobium meliloti]|uniref:hypothetical protein n=1 Tax=Rhizobium meliloti TaxID=382 RepID=UPI000FD9196D|nr:hypothetical protein [Sinorhizobium meliloti]RVP07451.1 hypothetical protein CN085_31650 [Sinorhizobium meliloti]
MNLFEHQVKNIPDLADEERDAERYLPGLEFCHENIVPPYAKPQISHEVALDEMRRHGDPVCQTPIAKLEKSPGVPNQLTLGIDEVELPETRNSDCPMTWSHRELKLTRAQADFLTRGLNSRVHERATERNEFILRQREMIKWRRREEGGLYYLGLSEKGEAALSHYRELQAKRGR